MFVFVIYPALILNNEMFICSQVYEMRGIYLSQQFIRQMVIEKKNSVYQNIIIILTTKWLNAYKPQ